MKKGLSVVISATDSANARHYFLSTQQLRLIAAGLAVVVLLIAFAVVNYARVSYKALEAVALKRRNQEIEKEFAKLQEFKRQLEVAENHNQKIKVMLGIEKTPLAVQPQENNGAQNQVTPPDSAAPAENIPSILPTMGQISKSFGADHEGIDIAAPLFAPVLCAANGTVRAAGWDSIYGNYLIVEHSKNYATFYGHLHSAAVKTGDVIAGGKIIGTIGSSGKSTSPHLHYEVRFQGKAVDPMAYLPYVVDK